MRESESPDARSGTAVLEFRATNVTATRELPVEVQPDLPAETVARSVASLMALPDNVPWALRDDASSRYLEDARPIGEQIAPGARVTVTPKTHLGGAWGSRR